MSATPGAPVRLPHPRTGVGFPSPVPPGSGWPADPAGSATPVARSATDVVRLAEGCADLAALDAASSVCRACPRLVTWREDVAVVKRRAFRGGLGREGGVMRGGRAFVGLGGLGWGAFLGAARGSGWSGPTPAPRFG